MFTSGDVPPAAVPAATAFGTRITPRAFFLRIGQANAIWLYTQAQTNAVLEYYKDMVWSGSYVDLADPVTSTDLNYLLTLSGTPFTADIIAAILTNPVQPSEIAGSR
jgi:hypothetical protein